MILIRHAKPHALDGFPLQDSKDSHSGELPGFSQDFRKSDPMGSSESETAEFDPERHHSCMHSIVKSDKVRIRLGDLADHRRNCAGLPWSNAAKLRTIEQRNDLVRFVEMA